MCGRVVQAMSWSEIHHLLNIHSEPPAQAASRYNVAPTMRGTSCGTRFMPGLCRSLGMRWTWPT